MIERYIKLVPPALRPGEHIEISYKPVPPAPPKVDDAVEGVYETYEENYPAKRARAFDGRDLPPKVDGDTPEERAANQQKRQIFRRYGIDEQVIAQLCAQDFEMKFVDRHDVAVGILELEDRRSGWCVSWMPMMRMDGNHILAFTEALATIKDGRQRWNTLWANVPPPEVWWIV